MGPSGTNCSSAFVGLTDYARVDKLGAFQLEHNFSSSLLLSSLELSDTKVYEP